MNIQYFMQKIIIYYGEYENQELKKIVAGYIKKEIKQTEYEGLLKTIYSYHKAIFKAPCIATIEECIDKARIKKGKYEPFIVKATNTEKYDYRKEAEENPELYQKVDIDLKGMLKNKVVNNVNS